MSNSIEDKLNTDFDPEKEKQEVDNINKDIAKVDEKISTREVTQQDIHYVSNGIRSLISKNEQVLETLANSLRQGASASLFESYAHVSNSMVNSFSRLNDLIKIQETKETNLKMIEMKKGIKEGENNALKTTSVQALQLVKEMSKSLIEEKKKKEVKGSYEVED